MSRAVFRRFSEYVAYPEDEMRRRSEEFLAEIGRRRTVREFSSRPVPLDVIDNCLRAAATAPSGANKQPWHFVVVTDPDVKARIRVAAETEESRFYKERAPQEWLDALAPLGTDEHKPFIETAPVLIAVFAEKYERAADGRRVKNYYVTESVGIATGILITALHHSGLATLTHTPSPMAFLGRILQRPSNESAFLLLVAGYPADDATVPVLAKKALREIASSV